jgi:A/G-specific adenine glycosylase
MQNRYFRQSLLGWNARDNTRRMPWKGIKDPYKIWLSEVILQQTRVEQGRDYYERFVNEFPLIGDLASAPEERIFKLWEGLGYYSRCKNLIHTARYIARELDGQFPSAFPDILALKGVGPYTAAAIASFAFDLPHAVVDGNVLRVLSRFFGVSDPIDSTRGKALLTDLAEKCLDTSDPAGYNQGLMDFGATVCKPLNPLCDSCPLQSKCVAYVQGKVDLLPVKGKKLIRKDRYFLFLVAEYEGGVYVRKRVGKDIWQNLYEFINCELPVAPHDDAALRDALLTDDTHLIRLPWLPQVLGHSSYKIVGLSPAFRQLLTHQRVQARFLHVSLERPIGEPDGFDRVGGKELSALAFPRLLNDYLSASPLVFLRKN